jgi:CDP-4-dehydro-6-deoxyglucose reductase, E1
MKKTKYTLASNTWNDLELKAIQKVIDSGNFTMGDYVRKFEAEFAKLIGSKYAIMVNSGSSANLLMIAALFFTRKPKLKKGDEVIVPAVSWSTTYTPLQQYGLKLRFVDIDLNTLNIDLNMLEKSITKKTKMIFLVNLLGNPNDFNSVKEIIKDKDIIIIEDNCESLGASYNGQFTGTFGLMGSFSSFFSHHICTMEGGLVATNDKELYHIMLSLRAHGWTRDLPNNNCVNDKKSKNQFEESFNFVLPGYNLRPLEIEAAVGLEQLKKLTSFIEVRRKNAIFFKNYISQNQNIKLQKEIGKSSWFGFSMIVMEGSKHDRNHLINTLKNNNIEYRPIVGGNFVKNSVLKYFDYEIPYKLHNANYINNNGLFIGNHHYDISKIIMDIAW